MPNKRTYLHYQPMSLSRSAKVCCLLVLAGLVLWVNFGPDYPCDHCNRPPPFWFKSHLLNRWVP